MLTNQVLKRIFQISSAVLLAFSLSSCVLYWTKTGNAEDPTDNNSILVYGYLDDSQAPFKFRWGQLRQMLPRTDEPFHDLKLNKEGLFFLDNLPVGSYTVHSLGGPETGMSDRTWRWSFPSPSEKPEFKLTELRATKPGVYFMGAYKIYESKKGGIFTRSEYSSLAVQKPSELEILEQLREKTKDTKWDRLVVARIQELRKK